MSPKFKKKPIVVEAEQYIEGSPLPPGCVELADGHVYCDTARGSLQVQDRDWIIKDQIDKKYYPCDPAIFVALFEVIPDKLASEKDRKESFPTEMKCPMCHTNYLLTNRLNQRWCAWDECKFGKAQNEGA